MKKAFTLIELLVVIAIIAILAAILFPVFAQAKAAAKATVGLSNVKQTTLAMIMYAGDFDDTWPIGTAWNTGNDQLCYGAGLCFATWAWSVQPYMKSSGLVLDPLAPPNSNFGANQTRFDTHYTQFGYNWNYLSPVTGTTTPIQGSTSATQSAQPAKTVMIVSKWAEAENHTGFDWGTAFPGGTLFESGIDSPDCETLGGYGPIPFACGASWGINGFYDVTLLQHQIVAGSATGGVAPRATSRIIMSATDGHARKVSVGDLTLGTTYTPTTTDVNVLINDPIKYPWNLQ